NDGNVEETWKQVQAAWTNIQKKLVPAAPPAAAPVPAAPAPAPAKPPAPAPAQQAAAPAPQPAPAPTPAPAPAAAGGVNVTVRRGMPRNAEQIAAFINASAARSVDRMDIMMAFGQKSYLL